MEIDRRAFLATLGGAVAIEAMSSDALADSLEHYMVERLDPALARMRRTRDLTDEVLARCSCCKDQATAYSLQISSRRCRPAQRCSTSSSCDSLQPITYFRARRAR